MAQIKTTVAPRLAPTKKTERSDKTRPRLVTVVRKSDATGDPEHYKRQLVRRPWEPR